MLTADLVLARRSGRELKLRRMDEKLRARTEELAARYVEVFRRHVGSTRAELDEAVAGVAHQAKERKLVRGLQKLLFDRSRLGFGDEVDAAALRRSVFAGAAAARRLSEHADIFDRSAVLSAAAAEQGLAPDAIEQLLYCDLKEAQVLREFEEPSAEHLVEDYVLAQRQAVLLRASSVEIHLRGSSPAGYRAFFHKLKFCRLLYSLEADGEGGYRVRVDGPAALFDRATTRYGLQLALLLPALDSCARWELEAELRWGKRRERLSFHLEGRTKERAAHAEATLRDEVRDLLGRFAKPVKGWRAEPCSELLDLPGAGVCVPDLVFSRRDGKKVYLEVLGYWSRDAVFARVDLVEAGLEHPILFAVPQKLRVSSKVLGAHLPAAIHVFKGVLAAGPVAKKLDALAGQRG